ncbi:acyl-CoA thioesterase-2 [Thermomonospora echinospora]|uniref:Acyl-CoA thioesterase-2 n=1 Tax=Thermomonospora echinospora TaxID=1992 RepID=A0A1H6B6Z8_9ACTN|nr:acyl-CoA thioesterase domain-containing protein [Thermomonospora echinospora]SEG56619.1 acyl-CoA thioesterase-2 [Thermomonospora echinospora]
MPDEPTDQLPPALARMLALQPLDGDVFVADSPALGRERLFGGQVAAQSLRAACLTVDAGRPPHSLHAYFIRPGLPGEPLRLEVGRTRDGRTFSTRHVTAAQGGKPIFEMVASFHDPEPGHDWQPPPPAPVPGPQGLEPPRLPRHPPAFDIRLVRRPDPGGSLLPHPFWIRVREPLGDDPALHACLITYLSDMAVVSSAVAPGSPRRSLAMAVSLDHALWFHRPARVDRWLLYSVDPVTNFGARGLARGTLHTADGVLVASIAQEALLRPAGEAGLTVLRDRRPGPAG